MAAENNSPELILFNGRIATVDRSRPFAEAVAIQNWRFISVGSNEEIMRLRASNTETIDLGGRTVIPGLNDSHMHPIRGGLNYNMELRWDGVPSLADALRLLKEQAARTPPPQWVRVVGGWTEFQFAERRMPTLDEINTVAPDRPVFVLHLYDRALLNAAALRAVGYTKDTPEPPGGEIRRDHAGNPTGLLIARPNAMILYSTLAKGPKLAREDQLNSTRLFLSELNRFGVTSAIDAGGGFQNYPDDYEVINELHRSGELSVRLAYNLFTQKPKEELKDFQRWTKMTRPGEGDDFYRVNGAGEMLVFSAADFEDILQPRPEMPPVMEEELKGVIRHLAENRWPFRLHATYDETITHALNVYEAVNREAPFLTASTGSLTTVRPSPTAISSASRHWAGASLYKTGWHFRANTSLIATADSRRSARRRSGECWRWACPSVPARTPRACRATIRSSPFTGSSPATQSAG
jgi:predicted amidohydrolase YtcJ